MQTLLALLFFSLLWTCNLVATEGSNDGEHLNDCQDTMRRRAHSDRPRNLEEHVTALMVFQVKAHVPAIGLLPSKHEDEFLRLLSDARRALAPMADAHQKLLYILDDTYRSLEARRAALDLLIHIKFDNPVASSEVTYGLYKQLASLRDLAMDDFAASTEELGIKGVWSERVPEGIENASSTRNIRFLSDPQALYLSVMQALFILESAAFNDEHAQVSAAFAELWQDFVSNEQLMASVLMPFTGVIATDPRGVDLLDVALPKAVLTDVLKIALLHGGQRMLDFLIEDIRTSFEDNRPQPMEALSEYAGMGRLFLVVSAYTELFRDHPSASNVLLDLDLHAWHALLIEALGYAENRLMAVDRARPGANLVIGNDTKVMTDLSLEALSFSDRGGLIRLIEQGFLASAEEFSDAQAFLLGASLRIAQERFMPLDDIARRLSAESIAPSFVRYLSVAFERMEAKKDAWKWKLHLKLVLRDASWIMAEIPKDFFALRARVLESPRMDSSVKAFVEAALPSKP